jgi:hypothetical protein
VVRADSEVLAAALTMLFDFIIETGLEAPTGLLEAPYEAISEVADLERVAARMVEVMRAMYKCCEAAKASMSGAQSFLAGLGLVWNSTPVPAMMAATAPNLPRRAIAHFQ